MSLMTTVLPTLLRVAEDEQFNPDTVTPGVLGFAVTAVLALAVIFLVLDLNRRLRRNRVRYEVQQKLAVEVAERDQSAAAGAVTPETGATTDASTQLPRD